MTLPRMNISTSLNSKYMRYTYVMLTSLFMNNPDTEIHIYLLNSDLTDSDRKWLSELGTKFGHSVHFITIDKSRFPDALPVNSMWSLETYYRLMLLDVLPEDVDRLLYLDVDMIIDKSLSDLYFTDFEGFYFCACRDMSVTFPVNDLRDTLFEEHLKNGFTYFNAGMMLWNVGDLRGRYYFEYYIDLIKKLDYQVLAPDQDLLNYAHSGQIKFVDEYRYDLFSRMAYNLDVHYGDVKKETAIVHFAGFKPWEGDSFHYDIEKLWWEYAKETPFYHELLEEFLLDCVCKNTVYDTCIHMSKEKQQLSDELAKSTEMCRKLVEMLEG